MDWVCRMHAARMHEMSGCHMRACKLCSAHPRAQGCWGPACPAAPGTLPLATHQSDGVACGV